MSQLMVDEPVLAAAREAFRKYGYTNTTIERVAREAGLSRATLHRRGVTKALILAALAERATEDYRAALWPALTAPGSARERLFLALSAVCESAERNLELLIALNTQTDALFHDPGPEGLTRSVFTQPLERLLRDGAADGSLRSVEPVDYATVLFNLVGWTYIHLRTGHGWSPERAQRSTLDVAIRGLAAGEAGT